MARRGRCRCGQLLTFTRGPAGYKTRCPFCRAVVRLGPPAPPAVREVPAVSQFDVDLPIVEVEVRPADEPGRS